MESSTTTDQSQDSQKDNEDLIKFILNEKDLSKLYSKVDNDIIDYVSEISSFGLSQLINEPTKLKNEYHTVVDKTQELAFNNYKSFITTAQCTKNALNDFNYVEDKLENMIKNVPEFIQKCNSFSGEAKLISKRWRDSSLMLSKHVQLLEVLEIPQLMDNCVRNCYYEEALQLYSYVQKLNKKYGSSIPLIKSVSDDVEMFQEMMMNQLLKELGANIQLPACIKVINYLRRLNKFEESDLRIRFLIARDSWLESIIREINANNPMVHITKIIEANRVHLFDIVTQYRAIFADQEPVTSSNIKYYGLYMSGNSSANNNKDFNDSAILCSWINHKITQFLEILETDIDKCINNEFGHHYPYENLIESCFYFSLSMSRIGADVWPKLYQILLRLKSKS